MLCRSARWNARAAVSAPDASPSYGMRTDSVRGLVRHGQPCTSASVHLQQLAARPKPQKKLLLSRPAEGPAPAAAAGTVNPAPVQTPIVLTQARQTSSIPPVLSATTQANLWSLRRHRTLQGSFVQRAVSCQLSTLRCSAARWPASRSSRLLPRRTCGRAVGRASAALPRRRLFLASKCSKLLCRRLSLQRPPSRPQHPRLCAFSNPGILAEPCLQSLGFRNATRLLALFLLVCMPVQA